MQTVQRGGKGALTYTFLHPTTYEPVTLNVPGCSVDILDIGGSTLVSGAAVTGSSNTVTYTPASPWTYGSGDDFEEGYQAVWTLTDGTDTWERRTYFRITRRLFTSQVTDDDVRDVQPELTTAWTGSLAAWRRTAWDSLTQHVERALGGQYPGRVFDGPERFRLAHVYWTLRDFYRASSTDGGGDDSTRASDYQARGLQEIQSALGDIAVDNNDDGLYQRPTEGRQWHRVDWGN